MLQAAMEKGCNGEQNKERNDMSLASTREKKGIDSLNL